MEKGIYIFDNTTSFLNAMEQLSKEYKPTPTTIEIAKLLTSFKDVKKEIDFIENCYLNCFTPFRKFKAIKIIITGSDGVKYDITYSFNSVCCGGVYDKFYRYLKKRNNVYI